MKRLLDALARHAAERPSTIAFADGDGDIDYATLQQRVAGAAHEFDALPPVVGLLGASSIDWAICDLAMWAAGRTLVPLPHFFADQQLRHIVGDAAIGAVVAAPAERERAAALNVPVFAMPQARAEAIPAARSGGRRIVYTSGSTGEPKGVVLGEAQLDHICAALLRGVGATPADTHLSVLPFALLLENICGVYLPLLAGGRVHIAADVIAARGPEIALRLAEAAAAVRPTTTVLVPELLTGWVLIASVGRAEVPDSLRFVAVGGAAVPPAIAARAWELGLPVHEGYGLSECASVVAVNLPGARKAGTVGQPLPGCRIDIAGDGEIVVHSDAVMDGYLHGDAPALAGTWRTGDLGSLDADGYLHVRGRKDSLIVTPSGRNVSPEWIETMLLTDPRIARAVVTPDPDGQLAALLEPSVLGQHWFGRADAAALHTLVDSLCQAAPNYARPRRAAVLPPDGLRAAGLLSPNGRPRRAAIRNHTASLFPDDQQEATAHAVL